MDFRYRDYLTAPLRVLRLRRWMQDTPYWTVSQMNEWVLQRLAFLAAHADENVPYYHALFREHGYDPRKVQDFTDWQALPLLDKDTVREDTRSLTAANAKRLHAVRCQTSGSTGTALRFLLDRDVNAASFALFWRVWNLCPTWHLGNRQAALSGYAKGIWQYQRKTRILALSSFHMTKENARLFHSLIKKYKPRFLRGYPSALYLFGRLLQQENLPLHFPTVFTGAETLLAFQRKEIENSFGGKVIDHYSHWERCGSICQCTYGRYHAQNDFGYHEILRDDGSPAQPGELGRLVVTSLHNRAMPFLRYDTRDLAAWSEEQNCPCGSNFPIIDRIEGRIEDVVVTPEGRLVGRLAAALKYSPHIRLSQIVQESIEHIDVFLVCDPEYSHEEDQVPLERELRARLGNTIGIAFHKVDDIPRTKMGKLRFVISKVDTAAKLGHH